MRSRRPSWGRRRERMRSEAAGRAEVGVVKFEGGGVAEG